MVLVCIALACDAVIGNVQEGAMKRYSEGTTHVVLYSYAIGFCLIFVGLVATGDLLTSAIFAAKVPFLSARLVFF